MTKREFSLMLPLLSLIIFTGFYPNLFLDILYNPTLLLLTT
jgi:NADH:ubiquinone oxidoreductase subunit 4 (subunit M)